MAFQGMMVHWIEVKEVVFPGLLGPVIGYLATLTGTETG